MWDAQYVGVTSRNIDQIFKVRTEKNNPNIFRFKGETK